MADDRLLPSVQSAVPGGRERTQRVALGRLEAHDTGAEPQQLAARKRPRQVSRQVDDNQAVKRLHGARTYHYAPRALTELLAP